MTNKGISFLSLFRKSKVLAMIGLLSFLFACNPTRHLKDGQRLLTKVSVKSPGVSDEKDDLYSLSKQKPNRKILGIFRIYLGIYNLYYNKKNSNVKDKIGEPPVIYDSTLNGASAELMLRYLQNKGYYESSVNWSHKLKKKKAKVKFKVKYGPRYTIKSIKYDISNHNIRNIYFLDSANSFVKTGKAFSIDLMKKERVRIETQMKNEGYYKFSREYVVFEADSSKKEKNAKLTLNIKNKTDNYKNTDSLIESPHERYKLNKVIIRKNYNSRGLNNIISDTIEFDSLDIINYGDYNLKNKVLAYLIYLRPGQYYSLESQEETYSNLSSLRNFSYISIQYEEDSAKNGNLLDAYIDLSPRKQKSYTIESEGTNNGGNLGINGNLSFQNNNTFKGAEILKFRINAGLEAQQILTKDDRNITGNNFLPFNTLEFGPELSLEIPRFLLPFSTSRFSPHGNPRTTFNASFNYQERPDYIRNVSKAFISYSWNETPTKTHIINPFDLSYIKLNPSPEFKEILQRINNPFLRNSYTDNLILAIKYSFILNTQSKGRQRKHYFLRFNFESAGNLLSAITSGRNLEQNEDGSFNVVGIRYAQYLRSDIDMRFYQSFFRNTQMVYRLAGGLGIPYGNSKAMPFEKSFYAGGANGLRAWRARELGPGSLSDSSESDVDQIGNMQLEGNVEYRFPITSILEGAFFVDAGNIWNVAQKDSRPNTEFSMPNFWKATAIGIGTGIRLNFSFFVLRFDVAAPLKDPGRPDPYELKVRWRKSNLNLGIGYPF